MPVQVIHQLVQIVCANVMRRRRRNDVEIDRTERDGRAVGLAGIVLDVAREQPSRAGRSRVRLQANRRLICIGCEGGRPLVRGGCRIGERCDGDMRGGAGSIEVEAGAALVVVMRFGALHDEGGHDRGRPGAILCVAAFGLLNLLDGAERVNDRSVVLD